VGDITYLWTAAGWLYLAVVLDLFSRKVVGWCLSASPDTNLVLAALNQAATLRQITPITGILFHSDQGCQYTSHAYQDKLSELHIKASMSRKGNCWDNAVMERFFRSLKTESTSRDQYQTHEEMTWAVTKYIHFYNTKTHIERLSPIGKLIYICYRGAKEPQDFLPQRRKAFNDLMRLFPIRDAKAVDAIKQLENPS